MASAQFSPGTMLAVEVKMRADLNIEEAAQHIDTLERKFKDNVPTLRWIFVEPDVTD